MKIRWVTDSYRRYSRIYDWVFGPSLEPGRHAVTGIMNRHPGHRVLEIGIGTGLSMHLYPRETDLTGIDLSEPMLARARRRASGLRLRRIALRRMNAEDLRFQDDRYDKCVAMYVASVTPHPAAMVREMARVTRPGGHLYILNHFSRRDSWMRGIERALSPFSRLLGFEPLFHLEDFVERVRWQDAQVRPVAPFGYWLILHKINRK